MIERQLGRWEEVFVVNNKRNQLKIIGIKVFSSKQLKLWEYQNQNL